MLAPSSKITLSSLCLLLLVLVKSEAKTFSQCDFYYAIKNSFPGDQVSTWVCIANFESHYNTDALNTQTGDHGIFQISEIYWCSTGSRPGGGCNKRCSDFHDDDISDDIACVKTIYNEHNAISGNGFNAWTVYKDNCQGDTSGWVSGC